MADKPPPAGFTLDKPVPQGFTLDTPATDQPPARGRQSLGEALGTAASGEAEGLTGPAALPTHASVLQGVLNLPEGIAQALGFSLPGPLEAVRREAKKAPMPALGEFAGGLISPANMLLPGEAGLSTLARTGASALRGGIGGLFTPQEPGKFWDNARARTGLGALTGGLFGLPGARVAADAQHLLDNNIRVPPARLLPGGSVAEKMMGFLPSFPAISRGALRTTIGDYNRRLYDWVLDGLVARGAPVAAGSGGLNYVEGQIAQRLNRANRELSLMPFAQGGQLLPPGATAPRPGFQQDFISLAQDTAARMSGQAFQEFQRAVVRYFREPVLNNNGLLQGATLADAVSNFTKLARDSVRSANPSRDDYALADAYRAMANVMMEHSTGPQWARDLRDTARRAYAKYSVLEAAAAGAGVRAESVVSPSSFLASLQRQIGRRRYQTDNIPFRDAQLMKDLSEAVNRITGGQVPSGFTEAVGGLGALELARHDPHLILPMAAGAISTGAAYSPTGMGIARDIAQSPLRQQIPRGAIPGGEAAGEISGSRQQQ